MSFRRSAVAIILAIWAPLAVTEDDFRPCSSSEWDAYLTRVRQVLHENWDAPEKLTSYSCTVSIAQNFRGEVLNVAVDSCSVDDVAVRKSAEDAAYLASPLPLPENGMCARRTLQVRLVRRVHDE